MAEFSLQAFRFSFAALDPLYFPPGKAANVFRGAFGEIFRRIACVPECRDAAECPVRAECPYARLFAPVAERGPSGLADSPRPFVLRASSLDGQRVQAGETFSLDVHIFERREPVIEYFARAFSELIREGIGPGRGRTELREVYALDERHQPCQLSGEPRAITMPLDPLPYSVRRACVRFVTPTELKHDGRLARTLEFPILFARIRDRLSSLSSLYGERPLDIEFRAMGERAAKVRLLRSDLRWEHVERRSNRTGQVHPLGGFTGEAEYEGELAEFLPYLKCAEWTGVGRQTVWGKGELKVR